MRPPPSTTFARYCPSPMSGAGKRRRGTTSSLLLQCYGSVRPPRATDWGGLLLPLRRATNPRGDPLPVPRAAFFHNSDLELLPPPLPAAPRLDLAFRVTTTP